MRLIDSPKLGVQLGINGAGPFGRRPEEDLPGVLAILADLGYDGAETHMNAWYEGASAVRDTFARAELDLAAVHVFEAEVSSLSSRAGLFGNLVRAGCGRMIISAQDKHFGEEFESLARMLRTVAAEAEEHGMTVYYHPHHADFALLPGEPRRRGIDAVCESVDGGSPRLNLDLYWVYVGGADPVDVIGQFAGRTDYYHVKDGDKKRSSPLGQGEVPLAESLRLLASPDIATEWIVYEDPKPQLPPMAACRQAREYLREHGFVGKHDAKDGTRRN